MESPGRNNFSRGLENVFAQKTNIRFGSAPPLPRLLEKRENDGDTYFERYKI